MPQPSSPRSSYDDHQPLTRSNSASSFFTKQALTPPTLHEPTIHQHRRYSEPTLGTTHPHGSVLDSVQTTFHNTNAIRHRRSTHTEPTPDKAEADEEPILPRSLKEYFRKGRDDLVGHFTRNRFHDYLKENIEKRNAQSTGKKAWTSVKQGTLGVFLFLTAKAVAATVAAVVTPIAAVVGAVALIPSLIAAKCAGVPLKIAFTETIKWMVLGGVILGCKASAPISELAGCSIGIACGSEKAAKYAIMTSKIFDSVASLGGAAAGVYLSVVGVLAAAAGGVTLSPDTYATIKLISQIGQFIASFAH